MRYCIALYASTSVLTYYRAFNRFVQAKFAYGGLVLGSSQFTLLPQLPQKMTLNLKVVKFDSKVVILLCKSKSVTHSVVLEPTCIITWKTQCSAENVCLNAPKAAMQHAFKCLLHAVAFSKYI